MGEESLTQRLIFEIQGIQAAQTTVEITKQLNKQFLELTQTAAQFKAGGKVLIETFEGVTRSGDKASVTVRSVGGQVKALTTTFKENAAAAAAVKKRLDEDAAAAQRMSQQIEGLRAISAISAQFQSFAATANLTPQAINRVNLSLSALKSQIERTALTGPQILQLFNDIRSGTNRVFTEQERRLVPSLQRVSNGFKKAGDTGNQAAKTLTLSWQTFARAVLVQQVLRAFALLRTAFTNAIQQAADFQVEITRIRTLSQENQQASAEWAEQLREVSDAFGIEVLNVTAAAYLALSNQIAKGAEVQGFLVEASKFSQAAVTDLATSVNLLTGALNSFQLGTEETGRVSAVLFKTIELGRIRAEDMANTFGRTGVLANQLGVSIEELSALFASSTIQGIRFNEAQTLVRNLFLKLIKPTDAFKKLLTEIGVDSGPAAINLIGIEGVLQRIGEELETGGVARIGELFGRVRAISAATLFGRGGAEQFSSTLRKFEDSSKSFATAVELRFESAGATLQKEINQIKNFLLVDFGQAVLEVIRDVSSTFGGLAGTITTIAKTIGIATVAFVTFQIAVATSGAGAVVSISAVTAAILRLTGVSLIARVATGNIFSFAIAAAAAATVAIFLFSESFEQSLAKARAEVTEEFKVSQIIEQQTLERTTRELRKSLVERTRDVLRFISQIRREFNNLEEDQEQVLESINSRLDSSIKLTLSSVREGIRDLEREASNAEKRANEARERLREVPLRFEVAAFERSLTGADIDEQVKLLQDRIEGLTKQAVAAASVDIAKLDIDETLRLFDAIEKRQVELIRLQQRAQQEQERNTERLTDLRRRENSIREDGEARIARLQQAQVRVARAGADPARRAQAAEAVLNAERQINRRLDENFRQQREIEEANVRVQNALISQRDLQRDIQGLLEARQRTDARIAEQQKKTAEEAKEQTRERRKDFEDLRKAFQQVLRLDLESVRGDLRTGATTEQVREELNRQIDKALNDGLLAEQENADAVLRVIQVAEEKRVALLRQLRTQELKEELDTQTQILTSSRKAIEEQVTLTQKARKDIGDEAVKLNIEVFAQIRALTSAFTEEQRDALKVAVQVAKVTLDPEPLKRLVVEFNNELEKLEVKAARRVGLFGEPRPAQSTIDSFQRLVAVAAEAVTLISKEVEKAKLDEVLGTATLSIGEINSQLISVSEQAQPVRTLAQALEAFAIALDKVNKASAEAARLGGINVPRIRSLESTGTPVQGLARGGIVGGSGNGDTVPALLTPGEFVINAKSAAKFMPQLIAMNRRRFSDGGPVSSSPSSLTVNVGGIHTRPGQELSPDAVARAISRAVYLKKLRF